jgi:hypothetical protein
MSRTLILAIFALTTLAACGGGASNGGSPGQGPAANTDAPAPANKPRNRPANKPAEKPAEKPVDNRPAPNLFKQVSREDPEGWFRLNKDGQAEVLARTKLKAAKPSNYEFVYGVSRTKEPGPTEGKTEWDEWAHGATCALLYFIDSKKIDPVQALKDNAEKVAAGVPDPVLVGNIAWTELQGGEVVLAALNLAHGTYLVVGVVLDSANLEAHSETIVQWARAMKDDNAAD